MLLLFIHARISGNYLYLWYAIIALVPCAIVLGLGVEYFFRKINFGKHIKFKSYTYVILIIVIVLHITMPSFKERFLLRNIESEPTLPSVKLTRTFINPYSKKIHEVLTIQLLHKIKGYDPTAYYPKNKSEFVDVIKLANKTNKCLYVNLANWGLGEKKIPEIMEIIRDRKYFESQGKLFGMAQQCTRYVYVYVPNSYPTD